MRTMNLKELREKRKAERKYLRIGLPAGIVEKFKYLSACQDRSFNDLIAEAAEDLLMKYEKKK